MNIIWSGRLIDTFYGYKPGRIYELSDGCKWTQADLTDEPAYPGCPDRKARCQRQRGDLSGCRRHLCHGVGASIGQCPCPTCVVRTFQQQALTILATTRTSRR
jgi:hypothetical protein